MSLLSNLTNDGLDIEESGDSVGGGSNFGPVDSGVYTCNIDLAYISESSGGAGALNLHLKTEDGREVRQIIYMTSGRAKGQKHYYEAKDGTRKFLPGYEQAMNLGLLSCGEEPNQWTVESKVVNLWNREAKKEVPTTVDVVISLMGRSIKAGILKLVEDKNVQNDAGDWVPGGETREANEVDKFFRAADDMTVTEIKAQEVDQGAFIAVWAERWNGKVKDKSTKDAKAPSGSNVTSGAFGKAAASAPKPEKSLFSS